MTEITREQKINEAFVTVANTLTDNYDVVDLLSTLVHVCTELLEVHAGGILLADSAGDLELVASTSEEAELVEIMVIAAGAGPCVDCYVGGVAIDIPDIREHGERWPHFRRTALEHGFRSVHATPMRLRGRVIGAMNLLGADVGGLSARDAELSQALADVATIGILHERSLREHSVVAEQLHLALDTRIFVEQAKGVLAQTQSLTMSAAFYALRQYAREHDLSLRTVAQRVVDRTIVIDAVSAETVEGATPNL